MPFIKPDRRPLVNKAKILERDLEPGDRCYRYYKRMVDLWRDEPRWTTAHKIYKTLIWNAHQTNGDELIARNLAWQVFFNLYVMPYEEEKRRVNGDV